MEKDFKPDKRYCNINRYCTICESKMNGLVCMNGHRTCLTCGDD